jgi:hypothetical protein
MKIFYPIIGISVLALMISCTKDQGNYDYHDINELTVGGLKATYVVTTSVDTLRISPAIVMTEPVSDPSRMEYTWLAKKGTTIVDTLGTAKELNYPVSLPPDNYTLQVRILDKQTKVVWTGKAALNIGTPYSRGIMLMGEDANGNAEVDMLSMVKDTIAVKGILAQSGLPTLRGPINIQHSGGSATYMKLWVFTNSGSYYLDRLTMKGKAADRFGKLVYTTDPINKETLSPIIMAPQIRDAAGNVGSTFVRAMMTGDGNIFTSYMALNGGDFYANPINRNKDDLGKLLKAAPYLLYPINNISSMLWYDTTNERFMNYSSFILNTSSVTLTDAGGDIFPWNQAATGRSLVYAENTRNTDGGSTNGNSFAIMKDKSNTHYIYKFYANGTAPAKRAAYTISSIATNFDKADFYAFSSNRSVVFYSVGNRLYAYDYNPGNEKAYQFPAIGTDEISMLKFDTQIDYLTNSLYIATYNATTKGTLRRFVVGSNPSVVELTEANKSKWSNLVKIKNMSWRAVN